MDSGKDSAPPRIMGSFAFTADEWATVNRTLDCWADTLIANDDRQARGAYFRKVMVDGQWVTGMCVRGALSVAATGEYPTDEYATYDLAAIRRAIPNSFILDLIATTVARQQGVTIPIQYDKLAYLNDDAGIPFACFASAIRNVRAIIAEHVTIVEPTPVAEAVTA